MDSNTNEQRWDNPSSQFELFVILTKARWEADSMIGTALGRFQATFSDRLQRKRQEAPFNSHAPPIHQFCQEQLEVQVSKNFFYRRFHVFELDSQKLISVKSSGSTNW